MTICELTGTYVHHLSKPQNLEALKAYYEDKDGSVEKLAAFGLWLINTLRHTEAWGKPKTNMMINKFVYSAKATINKAKNGKTSAYGFAGILLSTIKYCKTLEARASRLPNPGLPSDLTTFEKQLSAIAAGGKA